MADIIIHPTAIVSEKAKIGLGSQIGPYCVIDGEVTLGSDSILVSHVVLSGRTTIGTGAKIYPFASIGHQPQDLKYSGEPSTLDIGDHCTIREGVTMNPGT